MQPGSLRSYQKLIQDWENRVEQGQEPSVQELNELTEAIGREFCKLPPDYNKIMNPENETSFSHTFGEAIHAFYVFCLTMKEILIWPVKLALRTMQRMQR